MCSKLKGFGAIPNLATAAGVPGRGAASGHLQRSVGAGSGRKVRYGRLLVEALADGEVPRPLAAVLADALTPGSAPDPAAQSRP